MNLHNDNICRVLPLRINLNGFYFTKKQRKIISRARRFTTKIQEIVIDDEKELLFYQHTSKFEQGAPTSIYNFISTQPSLVPCQAREVAVYDNGKLVAASFFDLGLEATSSIYGFYDLNYSRFSLGIYTMLAEIQFSLDFQKKYYYHGYCYDVPSFYDYKKRFNQVELFDWQGRWHPLAD